MAKIFQAVRTYGPALDLNPTIKLDVVAKWMAMRTSVNKSEVMLVLQELHEALVYFTSQGTPVKLPGVGTFSPSIDRDGTYKVNLRADSDLRRGLNGPGAYTGPVRNKKRIGLSDEGYKILWDADNPNDPLSLENGSREPVSEIP